MCFKHVHGHSFQAMFVLVAINVKVRALINRSIIPVQDALLFKHENKVPVVIGHSRFGMRRRRRVVLCKDLITTSDKP